MSATNIHTTLLIKINDQELQTVTKFMMVHKINDHVRISATIDIEDRYKDTYLKLTDTQTPVIVYLKSTTQAMIGVTKSAPKIEVIFKGIITKLNVRANNDNYLLEVGAASNTYNMDIQRNKRSFKDKTMKYSDMVQFLATENKNAECKYVLDKQWDMDKFFMQYEETDWQFMKRMASRVRTGLVADPLADGPKLTFGIEFIKNEAVKFEDCNFTVEQDCMRFHRDQAVQPNLKADDYVYYIIKDSREKLDIGNEIKLSGRILYVSEATLELIGSDLKHHYTLVPLNGLKQKVFYNDRIQGTAVNAYVLEVVKDQVKLHLEFDKNHDTKKDCTFPVTTPYSAENHTGWHMMPETNDLVKLYFPDNFENNAYVITSVREKALPDSVESDVQILRNKHGQQMMAGSGGLRFTTEKSKTGGSDQLVRVHKDAGVQITSDKTINIVAVGDLLIRTKGNAELTAANELLLCCRKKNTLRFNSEIKSEGTEFHKMPGTKATAPEIAADLSGIIFASGVIEEAKPKPQSKPEVKEDKKSEEEKKDDDKNEEIGLVRVNMPLPKDKSRYREFTPYLDKSIATQFNNFVEECQREKIPIVVSEGFRTREYQTHLYEVDPDAARPGTSPHESGLAFDLDWKPLSISHRKRVVEIAKKYNFHQTVSSEKWHFGINADRTHYQKRRDFNSKDWLRIKKSLK